MEIQRISEEKAAIFLGRNELDLLGGGSAERIREAVGRLLSWESFDVDAYIKKDGALIFAFLREKKYFALAFPSLRKAAEYAESVKERGFSRLTPFGKRLFLITGFPLSGACPCPAELFAKTPLIDSGAIEFLKELC